LNGNGNNLLQQQEWRKEILIDSLHATLIFDLLKYRKIVGIALTIYQFKVKTTSQKIT
jgi:hypothetical protein